jgi:KUP system potassium uptake protein
MMTWRQGRVLHLKRGAEDETEIEPFIRMMERSPPFRPDGTAVYLTVNASGVPHALLHNLYHNRVLHSTVLIVTVKTKDVPHVLESERIQVQHLRFGFHKILVSYGFKDDPDLPRVLELSKSSGIDYEPMKTSYFLGRDTLVPKINAGLSYWRKMLYIWMFKNSSSATEYFRIPPNRVIELGTQRVL